MSTFNKGDIIRIGFDGGRTTTCMLKYGLHISAYTEFFVTAGIDANNELHILDKDLWGVSPQDMARLATKEEADNLKNRLFEKMVDDTINGGLSVFATSAFREFNNQTKEDFYEYQRNNPLG